MLSVPRLYHASYQLEYTVPNEIQLNDSAVTGSSRTDTVEYSAVPGVDEL
jgi:hypothetical protein